MSSDNVANEVAKRLKYYLDIQRREDAFDLSGPNHPERNHPFARPGSSLAYDGLHDRSLKHYYREKGVKQQLQKMKAVEGLSGREKQVKRRIEKTMREYNYRSGSSRISPYAVSLLHQKGAAQGHEPYYKTGKSSKKKQRCHVVVGKEAKVNRRAPDEKVSPHEKERLVNVATKLIVATETIALPKNRKSGKGNSTDSNDSFPFITGQERRASSASDPGPRAISHRSKRKHATKNATEKKWYDTTSDEISLGSTLDTVRSQMQHLKLEPEGDSSLVSHNEAANIESSASQTKPRPKSAGEKLHQSQADYDYDDFYDHLPSHVEFPTSPKGAWKARNPHQSVDSSTQTVHTIGTQTDLGPDLENAPKSQGAEEDIIFTNQINPGARAQAVQRQEALPQGGEQRVVPYEIYVVTGDRLGAGTSSDVKITIFGNLGSSGERPLILSKSNKKPFQRKQVDLFTIDSRFLGDLTTIRIGHNGTALGTGWFLDRVMIRDETSPIAFEFKCERWLSARDDDGQIVRDLPISNTIQAQEIPQITETRNIYFKHRPISASSLEGKKIKFRPLSASSKSGSNPTEDKLDTAADSKTRDDKEAEPNNLSMDSSTDDESTRDNTEMNSRNMDKKYPMEKATAKAGKKAKVEERDKIENNSDEENKRKNKDKKRSRKEGIKEMKVDDEEGKIATAGSSSEKHFTDKEIGKSPLDDNVEEGEKDVFAAKEKHGDEHSEDKEDVDISVKPTEDVETTKNSEDSSNDSSGDESSSSDSEIFSVTPSSTSNSTSENESENSADEEEVERDAKDTSKRKDSDNEVLNESAQSDYMAGFLAGVRANEQDTHREADPKESVLTKGVNIHQASESGDFERVKELINEVPELKSKPDERGWTPLHIVTAFGHLEILKWLSVNGVNLEEQTPTGFTAIHLASMNGHVKCIMVLAAMGCPISSRAVDQRTPLHLAAMSGHVECVKWLLANRANPNVRSSDGRTPLDVAVEYQQEECIELLQLMYKEMKRKDSVITKLRHATTKDVDEPGGSTSKGTDSGIGGIESGDDEWISDVEGEVIGRGDRVSSAKSRGKSPTLQRKRSKQEERAIEEMEEKRRLYEKQQRKMQRKESSFLDSIRQEVDSGDDDQDF